MTPGRGVSMLDQVAAVARRDLRIQLTYPLQLLLLVANVPFVLFTYFFLGQLVGEPTDLSRYAGGYFEFALIGFVVMSFATVGISAFSQSIIAEQRAGTLEVLLASPEGRLGPLLSGSLVVPIGLATIQAVLLFTIGIAVSDSPYDVGGILLAVPLLLLTILTFCAFGIGSAASIVLTKRGDPFSTLLLTATNLVAGALFPVALLPGPLRLAARLFPAFYGFEGMREVLLAGAGAREIAPELAVLVGFVAVLLPLSVRMFSRAVDVGRVTGTLASF